MSEESKTFWDLFMKLRLDFEETDPGYVFWMADEIARERYVIHCKDKNTLRQAKKVLTYREINPSAFLSGVICASAMRTLKEQVELMEDPQTFVQVFEKVATEAEKVYPGIDLKLVAADYPWTYQMIVKMDAYTHNLLIMPSQLVEMKQTYAEFLEEVIGTAMRLYMNKQRFGDWL